MVRGLDLFRKHFEGFGDHYLLIGGAACDVLMDEAAIEFRATKDLDIVLCLEVLDEKFVERFWDFIADGKYEFQQKSSGEKQFYRFKKPEKVDYPMMLELFSRKPDILQNHRGGGLTPIPVTEEVSSLSAILMDEKYYEFIRDGRKQSGGIALVGPDRLIPLKARAWLDLSQRKEKGEKIDSKDIRKHRNDIFRLYQLMEPQQDPGAPDTVKKDLLEFIERMKAEEIDTKALGLGQGRRDEILSKLTEIYRLGQPARERKLGGEINQ